MLNVGSTYANKLILFFIWEPNYGFVCLWYSTKKRSFLKINRNIKLDSLEGRNNIKSDLTWNLCGKLAAAVGWFSPLALKEWKRGEKARTCSSDGWQEATEPWWKVHPILCPACFSESSTRTASFSSKCRVFPQPITADCWRLRQTHYRGDFHEKEDIYASYVDHQYIQGRITRHPIRILKFQNRNNSVCGWSNFGRV